MWKDSETELDFLDFDYLIAMLKEIIEDETLLPSSVGVYGDWGSGKSSLIRMSMKNFEKEKDTVCLVFNGWLFEGYEDAKTALLGSILDTIQSNRTLSTKAKKCISGLYKSVDKFKLLKNGVKYGSDFFFTGGIGTISDMALNSIMSKLGKKVEEVDGKEIVQTIQDELNNKEIREDIKKFQNSFADLLAETNINRLVIFIDELDRCSPDTILETLEAIRLFLFTGKSVFIIGADERHISYAVKRKFDQIEGQKINIGQEYLEKIIQYPIRIPRLNSKEFEFYITCLLFEKDLSGEEFQSMIEFLKKEKVEKFLDFNLNYTTISKGEGVGQLADKVKDSLSVAKQLSAVLSHGLNGNPRHCKRFLNSLVMREKMGKYKQVDLDRKILAKIMLLEYFKSGLFRKLAELQDIENGKPKELILLEDNTLTEDSELKIWKDDKWVQDWCQIEPKLSNVDLRPYFYFSRASLTERVNNSIEKLSPTAKIVLEKLMSKSRTSMKEALKLAAEMNDYESAEILQTIFNKIIADTSIDKELFKAFLEWGNIKKTLHTSVLNDLSGLSGDKITLPLLPLIKDFVNKTNQRSELQEILEKWSEENPKLKIVIEREFKS
ncbi:NTPase [Bacillus cereus]|uniref:KAP family P-loop NTPase fold protein n=1 Tax=Bacillus cereus TaxID=1396 RepID=UPI000BEBF1A9|nr:P-loop NTPase fold protein [Bacillus cereus]PEC89404.1 NTPase [Bacillus cereus]PFO03471.1 NTPase [Bacillus cereus]PFO75286.1 NTPase [Bacillus cereus]PGN75021.1 NTPase [Bacillus cereus]